MSENGKGRPVTQEQEYAQMMRRLGQIRTAREDYEAASDRIKAEHKGRQSDIDQAIPEEQGDVFGRAARNRALRASRDIYDEQLERAAQVFGQALRAAWMGHAEVRQR